MQARTFAIAALSTALLSACYVVPVTGRDGAIQYYPVAAPPLMLPPPPGSAPVAVPSTATGPIVLSARLYPENEAAAATGLISGTVTNMLNGKGRFQLDYRGEVLTGEATIVDASAHRGVASATGSSGGYMSCEYQLANARQGAGSCMFSSGARYRLHIGS